MHRSSMTSWFALPRPNPAARLRLFCFPYAGAGATVFYPWTRALPAEVEICPVQLPGREARMAEPPYTDVMELVERIGSEIRPFVDRPFAFFGHSNGAIVSFELARLFRREGRAMPEHLFLSGRPASQVPSRHPRVFDLPDAEFVEQLRRLEGTPEEVLNNPELMQLLTPLLRADFSLAETYAYQPEPPLAVPISAYGGAVDKDVNEDEVRAWGEQTSAAFHCRIFPGGHFFLNENRDELLAELSRELGPIVGRLPARAAHA